MSLIVKIQVLKLGVTKAFKFEPSDRVEYVINQVQEKTAGTQAKPNENFGIFLKDPTQQKKSFWLLNSRTLKFYDIENGATLQYKDKNRYLKVKMLDKTIKTVLVDDSKSVGHALDIICQKIGITNSDEFALFIEEEKIIDGDELYNEEEKLKTNTIRRVSGAIMKGVDSIEQRRVEKIKEKAHTDDDTNWLANDKTLRESGVQEETLVVIRRRFMFEQSINITNPIEIALLYAQSCEAILDGSHPCDFRQAAQFAAYMIQVQHGNFDENRYRAGQLDFSPREYLPKEYQKNKEVVKKIKEEHRKLSGLNELDAKYKYIQLCQNLKTYGVTFFLVKEVVSKKNKLQPCLFGVCKESVMKVDEKTKQIIKEWPLTSIKNWAASPNSFTLDFGSYTDGMYSVQTYEGAQIGQLIGGYIDIILKRKKKIHQRGYNDDELGVIAEDIVAPHQRNFVQQQRFKDNEVMMPKIRSVGQVTDGLSAPQKTLIDNIDNSGRALLVIMDDLDEDSENPYAELEPIRQARSDQFKVENVLASISVSLASISHATAVSPEELDYTALNEGITKITSNMTSLARYLKYNAKGLGGDTDGKELIGAARNLSDTFKILLTRMDPQKQMTYEEAYDAMNQMADASISIESVLKKRAPDAILKGLVRGAEEIERATILLSDRARQIASTLDESSMSKITSTAKHVFLKSQGMVVASKVMAPYLHRPDATEQLSTSIRILSKDVKALASMCIVATDDDELRELVEKAAQNVSSELGTMLQLVQNGSVADILMVANEGLLNSIGNPEEMKELTTLFIQAYSRIAKGIRANVDVIETNDRDRLLNAAKNLTDALKFDSTVREDPIEILEMIGDAAEANLEIEQILNNNPTTAEMQRALLETVKEIYDATKALEEDAINIAYLSDNQTAVKVRDAANRVILRSTALVTSAKVVAPYVESPEAVKQMVHAAKVLSQDIKNLTVLCNEATKNEHMKEKIDDTAHTIVEGLGRMLKLFQDGVVPEKIPELVLEVNDKFLKSIGDPENMRKQAIRFDKPYSRIIQRIPEKAKELNEDDKNKLLDAARNLSDAMKIPLVTGTMPKRIFEKVEAMAEENINAEHVLKENKAPIIMQKALLQAAEKIEKAVATFENQTKKVMDGADRETASKIANASATAAQKGRGMVVGTKVISPYVKMSEAVDQMNDYAKAYSKDIIALRDLCQNATDSQDMKSLLHGAAEGVTNALNNFLKITQNIGKSPVHNIVEKDIFEVILEAQEKLVTAHGRSDEMIKQATILGQVYSQLIRTMQAKSDLLVDSDEKENLLAAAAELSDATTELLAAAKRVKDNPKSKSEQDKLKSSSIRLRMVTNSTTNNALKRATAIKLESTARQASLAVTKLIGIGKHSAPYNTDVAKQKEFEDMSDRLILQEGKHLMNSVKEDEQHQGSPQALLQLINASKAFVTSSVIVVNLSKSNVRTMSNQNEASILGQTAHTTEAMVNALSDAAEKASGDQEEFDRAVTNIQLKLSDLDQAMLASMSDNLKPKTNDSIKTLEEKISSSVNKMREEVPDTVGYSHSEPEKTGSSVLKLSNLITPLSENVIAFAANLSSEPQTETLTLSKKVLDSTSELINASKMSCGLPEDMSSGIQDAADKLLQSLKDLLSFVKATSNEIDAIDYLVSNFDNVKAELDLGEGEVPQKGKPFAQYQDQMVKALKAISRDAHDMVAKGQANPKELSGLCEDLYENYSTLVDETKFAVVLANKDVGEQLRGNVHALGDSCKALVQAAGNFQVCPNDYFAKMDLSENAKDVSVKVAQIMSNLQKGSVGTQACINAISMLSGLLGDIDTTVMFAHAGTLDPEDEQSFGAHRETILWSSQKLVKDTKQLVEAAHSTQDQLAAAVREVLKSNTSLIDSVKVGSASLGSEDMNGQILLLNAVKDVTAALSDLINQTKTTSGNPTDDASNEYLKSSAKHMVGTLTALLKTVRSVEDEASRGARALESTVEAIRQAVVNYNVDDTSKRASPEDLIRATKGVTVATAKAVSAANSARQADIIEAANLGRKQVIGLIETVKAATVESDSDNVRSAIVIKVKGTAQAYCGVLEHVLAITTKAADPSKEQLTALSKKVAQSVGDLVKEAEQLKGSDLVNPEDPNVIAENELLGAAAAIEAAARKLAELKPRERPREADESLNFEEQILEAAKSITSAAHALVKAATVAQRELVKAGKVCSPESDVYADTQWSQGLISAARMVAEATSALCEAANAAVLGNASQEKLIASAQAVSASTAQLLLACRVKADPNSKAQRGLQHAGSTIKRASDSLVKAAQEAAVFENDEVDGSYRPQKESKRGLFIDELNAQEAILKQERALEKARKKLEAIRVLRYRKKEDDDGKSLINHED